METTMWALNPYQAFQTQSTKCWCILWKKYSQRAYFNEVIPTCFRGLVF